MTSKEIKNIIKLVRIRRQEIAHSPHPSAYREEYINLMHTERDLIRELERRYAAGNISIFHVAGRG